MNSKFISVSTYGPFELLQSIFTFYPKYMDLQGLKMMTMYFEEYSHW